MGLQETGIYAFVIARIIEVSVSFAREFLKCQGFIVTFYLFFCKLCCVLVLLSVVKYGFLL